MLNASFFKQTHSFDHFEVLGSTDQQWKTCKFIPKKGCSMYLQLNVNYHGEYQLALTHNSIPLSDKMIPHSSVAVKQNPAKSEISLRPCNGTNRQRAPLVCLCGLIWPWPAQGASWGTVRERDPVYHISVTVASQYHSRSPGHLPGWVVFISLLCNNTR